VNRSAEDSAPRAARMSGRAHNVIIASACGAGPAATCHVVPLRVIAGYMALHPLPTTCASRPRTLHFCRVHVNRDRVRVNRDRVHVNRDRLRVTATEYGSPSTENLSSPAD
jgi:hypothetical protein